MGFIEDLRDVIELEREILEEMLDDIRARFGEEPKLFDDYLPSLARVPTWEFQECVERLRIAHGGADVVADPIRSPRASSGRQPKKNAA